MRRGKRLVQLDQQSTVLLWMIPVARADYFRIYVCIVFGYRIYSTTPVYSFFGYCCLYAYTQ